MAHSEGFVTDGTYGYLIDGAWRKAKGHTIAILSPVDKKPVGNVQALSKAEVDEVFAAAAKAQIEWALMPLNKRAAILRKAADELVADVDELVPLLGREIAKDRDSARNEVIRTAELIRYSADEGEHMRGEAISSETFPNNAKDRIAIVTREPVGVVLAISPFNYPINLAASKIAPALIAGNAVVLKPATSGVISSLHLADAFVKAGLPKGVLNVVTGRGSEIGDYLVTHPQVNFVNFTGSTKVGRGIAQKVGMVPLLLELGGKDAAIVLADADLDKAAQEIVEGAYSYSGQRCTAVKRVLAVESIATALVAKIKTKVEALKVGNPASGATITPLINDKAADYVASLIEDAQAKKAVVVTGGKREGNLLWPVLLDQVTKDMRIAWEEPFGPVLPIIRVKDADEAVALANESRYGLQSAVFTKDLSAALSLAARLQVGTVHINGKTERGPDNFPFLGVKDSGMGTQGIRYSIEAMSRPKVVVLHEDGNETTL